MFLRCEILSEDSLTWFEGPVANEEGGETRACVLVKNTRVLSPVTVFQHTALPFDKERSSIFILCILEFDHSSLDDMFSPLPTQIKPFFIPSHALPLSLSPVQNISLYYNQRCGNILLIIADFEHVFCSLMSVHSEPSWI